MQGQCGAKDLSDRLGEFIDGGIVLRSKQVEVLVFYNGCSQTGWALDRNGKLKHSCVFAWARDCSRGNDDPEEVTGLRRLRIGTWRCTRGYVSSLDGSIARAGPG